MLLECRGHGAKVSADKSRFSKGSVRVLRFRDFKVSVRVLREFFVRVLSGC